MSDWKERINNADKKPEQNLQDKEQEVKDFLSDVVHPALEEIKEHLDGEGRNAEIKSSGFAAGLILQDDHGSEIFSYNIVSISPNTIRFHADPSKRKHFGEKPYSETSWTGLTKAMRGSFSGSNKFSTVTEKQIKDDFARQYGRYRKANPL